MHPSCESEYISVGANRFCSVSSADPRTGIVAFGAGQVVALWDPRVSIALGTGQRFLWDARADIPFYLSVVTGP